MKLTKTLLLVCAVCLASTSFAKTKTTPIVFAKGSSCGAFSGEPSGRVFTLFLLPKQTLEISYDGVVSDIIVKDPKGRTLTNYGAEVYAYETTSKGKYSVKVISNKDEFVNLNFCAYSDN
ncbi:hypothetical protein [Moraxella sp. VT-16-12]|uniref:hypothetical protein n=1 Tax=Moraxella sp. VT-16-12 TaxID=2014877 RepID=UPI000B7E3B9F|nr:hypothetical protein [Moraxella sp. VT-16-12]TWV82370.1 hypothetical protein CEW93_005545 [Moraxella sp. VT-16-12]